MGRGKGVGRGKGRGGRGWGGGGGMEEKEGEGGKGKGKEGRGLKLWLIPPPAIPGSATDGWCSNTLSDIAGISLSILASTIMMK